MKSSLKVVNQKLKFIFEFLLKNPNSNVATISREVSWSISSLRKHLDILENSGQVTKTKDLFMLFSVTKINYEKPIVTNLETVKKLKLEKKVAKVHVVKADYLVEAFFGKR